MNKKKKRCGRVGKHDHIKAIELSSTGKAIIDFFKLSARIQYILSGVIKLGEVEYNKEITTRDVATLWKANRALVHSS